MRFLNPYLLGGLGAVLVPILIHLLTRDRLRKVAFSTLRFFARNSGRVLRRKRFQEAMLLMLRVLIVAAVALAFARPLLEAPQSDSAASAARRARVIVADVSGSVSQSHSAATLRKLAAEALDDLDPAQDAAALITFANVPSVECAMSADFGPIRAGVDKLAPASGGTDIVEALRLADGLLGQVKAVSKEIVLISDLQRSGWVGGTKAPAGWKLSSDVKVIVKALRAPAAAVTIAELDCPESLVMDNAPHTVAVRISNQTSEDVKDLPVTLILNGKALATQKVSVRCNSSGAVRFNTLFDNAGDNAGVVYIGEAGADAAADKSALEKAYFNVRVIPRIKVVILNGSTASVSPPSGSQSPNPVLDGAFFLEKALAPGQETAFAVKSVLATQAKSEDIADAQVVIAASVSQVSSGVEAALGELLARGGGILMMPGETVKPAEFNACFGGLAPCRLRSVLSAEAGKENEVTGATIAWMNQEHPVFELFSRPHYGDFSTTRFFRWWEVTDSQTSNVLARFDDNRPAVLERQIGRGISMLLAGSADLRWSNLALRAIFLPYLHQTVRYLAIRTEKKTAFQAGDIVDVPDGWQLKGPSGQALADKDGKCTLSEVGICEWTSGEGKVEYSIAVNAAPGEAFISTVTPDEVSALVRAPDEAGGQSDALFDDIQRQRDRHNIWWYLALAAAAMFVLELPAANRTLRH